MTLPRSRSPSAGQAFDRARSLSLLARRHQAGDPDSYRFHLSSHPRWHGRIARLALDLTLVLSTLGN